MQEAQIVRDFLFPADQQTPGAVEPGMGAFDFPAASFAAAVLGLRRLVGLARHVRRVATLANLAIDRLAGVAFVETEILRLLSSGLGTFDRNGVQGLGSPVSGQAHWRLRRQRPAAHHGRRSSVERFTPNLPRSVGFFPVFFPAQRRFGHRPVHALPLPVDAFQLVVFGQGELPQLLEHAPFHPLLEIGVNRAAGAELLGHRLPLAAGGQHIQNAGHHVSHRQSRAAALATRLVNREHQIDPFPQSIGNLGETLTTIDAATRTSVQVENETPQPALRMLAATWFGNRIGS